MTGLVAVALVWALSSPLEAEAPAADKGLAAELLAQSDGPARERWLEAHRAQLTAGLGREVAAQARVLYLANRYDPAYDAFALAVRIGEIAADPESRIRGLEGLGGVERFRGRAQEALPLLERAMQEAEAIGDEAAVGRVLGGIGSAKRRLGEYGAALALFERQLAIFERLGDADGRARADNNIGIALGALGRCAEAIPYLEKSRAAFEAAGNTAGLSNVYNNLGNCHQFLGNYAAGLEAFGHCVQIAEATGKAGELAAPLNNIGELYRLQGAPERALDHFRRAYAAAAEPGEKELMAETLANEGGALLDLDRTPEARVAFDRALALGEEIHDPSVIAGASAGAAEVLSRLGDRRRALELLDHGLETAERTDERALMARTLRQIASLQLQEGRAGLALERAGRAADTARRYELPEELWPALLVTGRAERALGHAALAEAALREAVDVVEDLRAHAVGPDADRAVFLVPHAAPYRELVSLLADAGRSWDALAVAERSKGRALLDVLAGGRLAIGAAVSASDRAEERRREGDLLTVNAELRDLVQKATPDASRRKALEDQRGARRLALEDWRARQYAAHPELRVLRGESRPLAAGDVGSLLADGHTVLLEYVLCDPHAFLFVLGAGSSSEPAQAVHRLDLDSAELVRLARDLRARLAARDLEFAEPAERLYRALLSPARAALRGARRVVIVPDGALWDLPFQALRGPEGRFLIEDTAVSYVPSLSVLRDMQARRGARGRADRALLAIANPELETQVREIARLYDPRATAVGVGPNAREAWLKAEAPRYRILHLATHGVLDDASPLYSNLVLAAPTAGEHDDGLLEAREILDLDLGADLAVLSACETGRGRAGAGEGLIGMTWAFFVAGCPTTVASLWKVEAASTSRLMLAFHRELRGGRTPAEALRLAALAQLRRSAERHPFYWAGFVAMGDGYSPAAPRAAATLAAPGPAPEPYLLKKPALVALAARAPAALQAPILTVVDKPQASPSGDAHDYVSFARYTWPDPSKPDGLPYITRDGEHNRELVARGDHERLFAFIGNVEALAAAWRLEHDEAAARRAGVWLRAWFLTPATRMNPNLEFAQVRLGHDGNHGSRSGVLDARGFGGLVDALLLLHDSPAFAPGEEAAIRAWFKTYLDWLLTAPNARDEHAARNNHGSWFLAQAIPIARYEGRDDLARALCEEDKERIASQIRPDGSQPEEIRRVDGLGYSQFNLEAQFQVADLAAGLGIDLWNYTAPNGASLRRALEYLRPYDTRPETWPTTQNEKLRPGFLDALLARARAVWPDFPGSGDK